MSCQLLPVSGWCGMTATSGSFVRGVGLARGAPTSFGRGCAPRDRAEAFARFSDAATVAAALLSVRAGKAGDAGASCFTFGAVSERARPVPSAAVGPAQGVTTRSGAVTDGNERSFWDTRYQWDRY